MAHIVDWWRGDVQRMLCGLIRPAGHWPLAAKDAPICRNCQRAKAG